MFYKLKKSFLICLNFTLCLHLDNILIMKKLLFFLFCTSYYINAQNLFMLKTSQVTFFAGTPIEDIDAKNTKSTSFINLKTGDIMVSIPNKDFVFKRGLMQEHFNENYMESEKYPKSTFKGTIQNIDSLNLQSGEPQKIAVKGILNMHGVEQNQLINAVISAQKNGLFVESSFFVKLEDFKIDRPKIVWEKLAEKVEVKLKFEYVPYQK